MAVLEWVRFSSPSILVLERFFPLFLYLYFQFFFAFNASLVFSSLLLYFFLGIPIDVLRGKTAQKATEYGRDKLPIYGKVLRLDGFEFRFLILFGS